MSTAPNPGGGPPLPPLPPPPPTRPGRVLVTGADGLIGRATVAALLAEGIAVTAFALDWRRPSPADRTVTGDATEEADIAAALEGADAVVHLAAIPHRDLAPPYQVYRTNTSATFNVLSQAGSLGIRRAVTASSINAFGVPMNHHGMLPAYFPLDEEIPVELDDWYSLSKRSDELTAAMAASHWGMAVVALRFPYVARASDLRRHAEALIRDPGGRVREGWSYLDVRDAARAALCALTARVDGALVVGLSAADTLIAEDSAALLDRYAPDVPRRRPIPGRSALIDTSRAREALGFLPRHSLHSPDGGEPATHPTGVRP